MSLSSRADGSAKRLAVAIAYAVAVILGATLALMPSLLLFPQRASDDLRIALMVVILIVLLWSAWARPAARRTILICTSVGAAITLATLVTMRLLPTEAELMIPTPNVLPRLLGADGELADDTFFYEVINEIWLVLAAIAVTGRLLLGRKGRTSKTP